MLGAFRPRKAVKQFGLQRSGSNFLKFLLERNYDVEVIAFSESSSLSTKLMAMTEN